jgi:carboxypeptidase family protein
MIGCLLIAAVVSGAQAPVGTIAGMVTDASGGSVAGARITVVNAATAQRRELVTSVDGTYAAAALPPGEYTVAIEAEGFKRLTRAAAVEAGTTTTVDARLEVGAISDSVVVSGASPLLQHDHHQIGGVVTRAQIANLPLNGRNFLDLARLEPGVTNPVRGTNNRTFVAALGSGLQTVPRVGFTQITVDGASITVLHTIGAGMQVSQEAVQEFQMSTANFDLSTGVTTNGAINIVTRSGGNEYHGEAFSAYRDHHLAAYPVLRRDPNNPDPFFQRHQSGAVAGGPVRRDRMFFFGTYERHDQKSAVSVQPTTAAFAALGGIFTSPYHGNLMTARIDARVNGSHTLFVRHTYDGNRSFAPPNLTQPILPSGWLRSKNDVNQTLIALTSVLSRTLINDLRVSSMFGDAPSTPTRAEDCGRCLGLGAPRITMQDGSLILGNAGLTGGSGHRYQLTDGLTWQQGRHRLRVGVDWEHTISVVSADDRTTVQMTLWAPSQVTNPAIVLPGSFTELSDILQLPLNRFNISVGPGAVPQRDFLPFRRTDLYRLYATDTWRFGPRVTVDAGLAWLYEPRALNDDLTKPALLAPILGVDRLGPPRVDRANLSPSLGIAWTPSRDGRTVVRAGAGRYFDPIASANATNLMMERRALLPLGTTRNTVMGSKFLGDDGRPLDFSQPTSYRASQLLAAVPALQAQLLASVNPGNRDFSVRNIDLAKSGMNLSDPSNRTPSAVHASAGVQREVRAGFVVSADVVWRRFTHMFINGIDYNRFNTAAQVLRQCSDAERDDVTATCSNGNFYFDTTTGRARSVALLVRADKRFSGRAQLLASYALSSYVGSNGTGIADAAMSGGRVFGFNNDNWFENYGPMPTDLRHVLNVSGFLNLPWRLQAGFTVSAYSRPPFSAWIGFDFNGDGTTNDLLPGTRVNQFGRGLGKADLVRLVARYNEEVAGKPLCCGQRLPRTLTLPPTYAFDDRFFTQDVRLTRTFPLGRLRARLALSAEVFNLFNTANLTGFSGNLASPDVFGQPIGKVSQAFGSGGPRACQLGVRLSF